MTEFANPRMPPPYIEGISWADVKTHAKVFNRDDVRTAEVSSAGCSCSARGMAKLAAVVAAGGQLPDGEGESPRLLSKEAVERMQSAPREQVNYMFGRMRDSFTVGGVNRFE